MRPLPAGSSLCTRHRGQVVDPAVFHVRVARPQEREPRFLTWAEADEVRSWMPEHVCRAVPIAILTMLRRGELLGLRDTDVDLEAGAITIVGQAQHGQRTRTKTSAGRRTVDLGPAAVRLLREQQLARAPNPDGLLFPARSGGAYEAHNFMNRVFKPAARARRHPRAHLPRPPPHRRLADDRRRLQREGDRRADGPRRRRHARAPPLRPPLQGRPPAGRNRARIARFQCASDSDVGKMWDGAPNDEAPSDKIPAKGYGRYWARTSDPQLVDLGQPFAPVRARSPSSRWAPDRRHRSSSSRAGRGRIVFDALQLARTAARGLARDAQTFFI